MNIVEFNVPVFDWHLLVLTNVGPDDKSSIKELCSKYSLTDDLLETALGPCVSNYNRGVTLSNEENKVSVVVFSPITDEFNLNKLLFNETVHILMAIKDFLGIEEEGLAYINGYIMNSLYQLGVLDNIRSQYNNSTPIDNVKKLCVNICIELKSVISNNGVEAADELMNNLNKEYQSIKENKDE